MSLQQNIQLDKSNPTMDLKSKSDCQKIIDKLMKYWEILHDIPGVFSYKLNIRKRKTIGKKYKFHCQLNTERTKLRRIPQQILSLNPQFEHHKFNFTKISNIEKILNIIFENNRFTFIINNSPLTKFHTLICQNLDECLPQKLTHASILFPIKFLSYISNYHFRIGYNSPGALASVNHLHLHLMHITDDLYIDNVKLKLLKNNIYSVVQPCPLKAICFKIKSEESNSTAKLIHMTIERLCEENIPHNLLWTRCKQSDCVKVFVFVREKPCIVKDLSSCNIGICEWSGFVSGDENIYENLTEEFIMEKMSSIIGDSFDKLESIVNNIKLDFI